MSRYINIFLDDCRAVPDDGREWILVETVAKCVDLLHKHALHVDTLSLDHDLGEEGPYTGYMVAKKIEEWAAQGWWHLVPTYILCHSANPVGRKNILLVVDRINLWRSQQNEVKS